MSALRPGIGGILGAALTLAVLVGCANDAKGTGDAPVLDQRGEDSPAQVFNFPDGFGNLATKCVGHGYRAYVTTNNGGPSNISVVPDAACGDGAPSPTTPPSVAPTATR